MKYRKSIGEHLFDSFNYLLMILITFATLYPFIYVLLGSLSDSYALSRHRGLLLWPQGFNVEAYLMVLKNPMIGIGYLNTLKIVFFGTVVKLLMTVMGGYFFYKKNVLLKKYILPIFIVTMFIGGGLVPTYLVVTGVGLRDSIWALIIPSAVDVYTIIIMRTQFNSLPESLSESAYLDGAGELTILFKILIPLSIPVMAVMTLWSVVGFWNSWFDAAIYLNSRLKFPLQLILRQILVQNNNTELLIGVQEADKASIEESIRHAAVIISTLPILCFYPFLQKYFVKGVMVGALKE